MEMVTVKSFDNYFSANIILSRLQDAGIECYLVDEHTVTINYFWGNAIGGIKLTVKKEDVEKASEILKQFDEEYLQTAKCPRCGATKMLLVQKRATGNFITTMLSRLFSGYSVPVENVYQCQQCRYESNTLPENTSLNPGSEEI